MNNATIEIIYTILSNCEEYKSDANCKECIKKDSELCKEKNCKWHYIPQEKGGRIIWGVDYLLGQILRQIDVPEERKHLSAKAINKWKELGLDEEKIWTYNYQDWVSCHSSVMVDEYSGANKKGESVDVNKKGGFTFKDVFHDEHIVPINDILQELFIIPKEELTHDKISEYLDKIHVCRILKSEDRKIYPKYNRIRKLTCENPLERTHEKIYSNIYKKCGVIIPDFEK